MSDDTNDKKPTLESMKYWPTMAELAAHFEAQRQVREEKIDPTGAKSQEALQEALNGVKVAKLSEIGPMTVIGLPRFSEEQERLASEIENLSHDGDELLTPEENEEAFQVYMHRRMRQAQGLQAIVTPVPVNEERPDTEPEYLTELRKQTLQD
jgi:hypothetical protein